MRNLKVDDVFESPGGMQFVVTKVNKNSVHVDVQRTYFDNQNKMVMKVNKREISNDLFPTFSKAYKKVKA